MYNIHIHYENIFSYLKSITKEPVLLSFHPFGSINLDNLEALHCNGTGQGVIFLCYDQEPLNNHVGILVESLIESWGPYRNIVLLNTESNSEIKKSLLNKYQLIDCYYFFHIFAALDWYRGYQYCTDLIPPNKRKIQKKFITFNRITGDSRSYRSLFVAELKKANLLESGYVSYSDNCPEHGHYSKTIFDSNSKHGVPIDYINECKTIIDSINFPLRIDSVEEEYIPNGSSKISAIKEMMSSFLHVVTETCFWENKEHLTEKIFRPIVARQPFVLLGCPHNLEYLKRYGFKTFDRWWDESYDNISDPIERIKAVVKIIEDISNTSNEDLENMLQGMSHVLEHNYRLFYSKEFIDRAWDELKLNLQTAIPQELRLTAPGI